MSSARSRGPVQSSPIGDTSQEMFRQFSKTGEYIPQSMLAYYAAPISTGFVPDNTYPPYALPSSLL
jgi:hypothetical protein